jgi:hypothetical protein
VVRASDRSIPGSRPAFYALRPGGWRDYVTLLHLPYTAWHLSYVVVGGCLATEVEWWTLGLTVLAFALAMGVGAHALDELDGRPLRTEISSPALVALAVGSVAAASAIGVAVALERTIWILPLVAVGVVLVPLYNLELLGGRAHTDLGFALSWGAFPVLTAFVAQTGTFRVEALLAAAWATAFSLAQRRLSRAARRLRRDTARVEGHRVGTDGARETLTGEKLVEPYEGALRLLTVSSILVAATLVAVRIG